MIACKQIQALVDTGCSTTNISHDALGTNDMKSCIQKIMMLNCDVSRCEGMANLSVVIQDNSLDVELLVTDKTPSFDMILGMDVVSRLSGGFQSLVMVVSCLVIKMC